MKPDQIVPDFRVEAEGLLDYVADEQDDVIFGKLAAANSIVTLAGEGGNDGDVGFTFRASLGAYAQEATLGELAKFTMSAEGSDGVPGLVRGTILKQGTVTATANGTGYQVGAIGATQVGYAALHVMTASVADTLDVTIESDATNSFSEIGRASCRERV